MPADESRGCSPGLAEQSYLGSVGQRDSPTCGWLQYTHFDAGYKKKNQQNKTKNTRPSTDFPVGL